MMGEGRGAKGGGADRKEAFAQSVPIFRISFKLAWTESHQLFKRCNMMLPLLRQICKLTPRENKK